MRKELAVVAWGALAALSGCSSSPARDFGNSAGAGGSDAGAAGIASAGRSGGSGGSFAGGGTADGEAGADDDTGAAGEGGEGGEGGAPSTLQPCTDEGALECTGHNQRTRRECKDGLWEPADECKTDERCDTRPASKAQCKPVLPGCANKEPGQGTCAGLVRSDCGADLLTLENTATCSSFCVEQAGKAECSACTAGQYSPNGNPAACAPLTECAAGQYVSVAATATSNRQCSACAAGTYSNAANATSCQAWTKCTWTLGGLVTSGTATTNSVCGTANAFRQFGTSSFEHANSVGVDGSGNVYVGGDSAGDLFATGAAAAGAGAFLAKLDSGGKMIWNTQFGITDRARAIAVDASGNVVVVGDTHGLFAGTGNAGGADIFLRKYNTNGAIIWSRQFGSNGDDVPYAVALDALGDVFVAGYTSGALVVYAGGGSDGWLRKYDPDGSAQWTVQIGTSQADEATGVALDGSGNVYVGGDTLGAIQGTNAGQYDAWIRKYNSSGNALWTSQFGGADTEFSYALASDASGNVYIGGATTAGIAGSGAATNDGFVRKFNASGAVQWTRQFGSPGVDDVKGLAIAPDGSLYVAGDTTSVIQSPAVGGNDAFIRRYTADGSESWTRQFGSATDDYVNGIAIDGNGYAYIAGFTDGSLQSLNHGGFDAFAMQLIP